jgi:hypothetical protein
MERYQEIKYKPTEEQIDFFYERTNRHISLVEKYINIIGENSVLNSHDKSKFQYPEYIPYVHLTWQKKIKQEGKVYEISEDLQKEIHNVTLHHVNTNMHHPEFWDSNKWDIDFINKSDRDKPTENLVDATSMTKGAIIEMCADWCAMTEELNEKTPLDWADKNIQVRWTFNMKQIGLIYRNLDRMWK